MKRDLSYRRDDETDGNLGRSPTTTTTTATTNYDTTTIAANRADSIKVQSSPLVVLLVLRLPLAIFLSTVVIVLQDIRRPVSGAPRSSVGTLPPSLPPPPPPPLFLLPLLLDSSTNPNPRRREKEEQRGRARTIAGPTVFGCLATFGSRPRYPASSFSRVRARVSFTVFTRTRSHVTTISATIARRIQLFLSIENFLFPVSPLPCPPFSIPISRDQLPADFLLQILLATNVRVPNHYRLLFSCSLVYILAPDRRSLTAKRFRPRDYSHSLHPRPER